jgi:hypothetical protein
MLTDMQLRAQKPAENISRLADHQGLYAAVTPSGGKFRYDCETSMYAFSIVLPGRMNGMRSWPRNFRIPCTPTRYLFDPQTADHFPAS